MTSDDASGAPRRPRRRQVLRAATVTVLGAGAVTGTGAGILRALNADDGRSGGRLLLQADAASGVGVLERSLRDLGLEATGRGQWQTPVLDTSLVSMVGFTWRDGVRPPRILVRFRTAGRWSLWLPAPLLRDLPDPSSGEGIGKAGTSPVFCQALSSPADGIQVQVNGSVPPELAVTLIHAARLAGDARVAEQVSRSSLRSTVVTEPTIHSRAEWGADESWRDGPPRYNDTILQAHIHHSASNNGYSQADVPALIRSFYRYHTKSLGWSDIAYNFLVDSFGTIWEGRWGGVDRPVRGAHTLGFNAQSTGFCVIGNLDTVQPTTPTLDSLASLAAWKLAMYDRDPEGWSQVTSEGSDKFPSGKVVTLPVIDGHRDTNDTACPGGNLYAKLPDIRSATAALVTAATLKLKVPFEVDGKPVLGRTLTVSDGRFKPRTAAITYQWLRNGVAIDAATLPTYVVTSDDVGQTLGVVVTGTVPGVAPVQQTLSLDTLCRSIPVCTVRTQRKPGGKVVVHLEVSAPGIAEPDGEALIQVGDHQRTVTVTKGTAIARFVGVEPGRYKVRCHYSKGTLLKKGTASDWVRVPGRGDLARG